MDSPRTRKLPPPAALLFDLDGTLVDSVADLAASANFLRAHYGLLPLPVEAVRASIGDGARKLVLRTLAGGRDADVSAVDPRRVDEGLATFREHYSRHLLDTTCPYPGVRETLAALARRARSGAPAAGASAGTSARRSAGLPHDAALRLAVVSNKPQEMCEAILRGLDLARYFQCVIGARSGVPVKPAPDLLLLALREVHVEPGRAWVVGDSPNDVGAGKAAGCATVALTSGLCSREVVEAAGPDVVLDTFGGLLALLAG